MMPKPPKEFCIDSFEYKEYLGLNNWSEPEYADPVTIKHCRIDRGAEYTTTGTGKQLLYNAVIFCFKDITTPLPEFKTESIAHFDGVDHKIVKAVPLYEPFKPVIYSYELEVI